MKRLAKFLLRLSLAVLPCLMAACTSEVETIGETPGTPENPQANDPNRRSVVISLQNKLILVNGTPENRTAMTRDGIAEDDENRIESFDIYAFGSDKEEGPYTFQERFAYRAEAGNLPAGTSPLDLKSDEAAGKVNVVFYPRKGLFTKFYCVANQTKMNDATGHEYIGYTSLQQSSQQAGTPGDAVTTPGIPTENDFIKLNTPLLESTGFNNDILLAPLPMSGANGQPIDLREYSMGTYVRLNISLTRAVARFDVVNDAAKSHFTITDISMGNGRQGVTLFPIRAIGDIPATPGQLITYPYRPFDGLNANVGTTTKAFYCYPCKTMDAGFLILKGLYAMNLTDEKKEVSYRIPFERVSDGNGTRIEINHNHRYTVQITEADPFELTANIRLVDWETGDYIDDYEPDNGLDAITVSDLTPTETTYDANTNIVTLVLTAGSSFTVATGSNAGVEAKLGYNNGTTETEWLELKEMPVTATRTGGTQQVKYKVSFNESYAGSSYPRGILRLIDKAGGSEEVIMINTTFGIPAVEATGGTMNPDGVNNWDATENTLYLVQATGAKVSTGVITVKSIGGSKIELPIGSDITVSPISSTNTTQEYTFKWAGTDDADLTEKELTATLKNYSDETRIGNVKVKLLPNQISNLQLTNEGTGISLSDKTATTATLTMPIIKDRQFTIMMDSYGKPTVSKYPAWLEYITSPATRSTPESKTTSFTFKLIENAANFDDTQIVFTNSSASGGTGMTVNVMREFQIPTISAVSMDPSANSYDSGSKSLNLYQLKSSYYSTATLKVYSLGGSKLQLPSGVEADLTSASAKEQNYVIRYKTSSFSTTDVGGGTLYFKNLSNEAKSQAVSVTFKSSVPTITSNRDGGGITYNRTASDVDVYVDGAWGTSGETGFVFTFTSPAGLQFASIGTNNSANTRTGISTGSQSGSAGSIKNAFTLSFKSSASFTDDPNLYYYTFTAKDPHFPDYMIDLYMRMPVFRGKTPYKDDNTGRYWLFLETTTKDFDQIKDSNIQSSYPGWRLPTKEEWTSFVGKSIPADDGWYDFPSTSNAFNSLIPSDHWVKCATNDPNYRLDIDRPRGKWGIDILTYDNVTERRIYLISK